MPGDTLILTETRFQWLTGPNVTCRKKNHIGGCAQITSASLAVSEADLK